MANDDFPIDTAHMVAVFMERILLVSFIACLRTLLWSEEWFKPRRVLNLKMIAATALMFIIATLDLGLHFRRNLEAFVWSHRPAAEDFEHTSRWTSVITMGTYVAQTFVGDSILLYRCWVIYNNNWLVVAVPIVLWIGTCVCGVITIQLQATIDTYGKFLNMERIVPFITSMLCLTLATNVLTTSLIVYRIWKIRSNIGKGNLFIANSPLTNLLVVLIESGVIYTLSIVILCGVYVASNNAEYGVSNSIVQIIGITFNLVIISLHRDSESGPKPRMRNKSLQHPVDHYVGRTEHNVTSKTAEIQPTDSATSSSNVQWSSHGDA